MFVQTGLCWVRVVQSSVFCVFFVKHLLSFCSFFWWSLYCLSFFDLRLLITLLVFFVAINSNDYSKNLILDQIKNLNGNNKIYLYKFLKQNENEMEYYLSHPDRNVRLILTKCRLSDHKHLIEIGRYLKIPRIKDYVRFTMSWKMNFIFSLNAREIPIIEYFQDIYSNFLELNHEEKLTKILNPSVPEQIRTVTSFIRQSLELRERERERDSSQS